MPGFPGICGRCCPFKKNTMSQTPIYKPQAGSVAHRVLSFLQANPDEELTRGDIAVKFDASQASIDTLMQLGVSRGAFKRGRNKQMDIVWTLGAPATFEIEAAPAPAAVAPVPAPAPAESLAPAQAFGVGTGKKLLMPFDSPIIEGGAGTIIPNSPETVRQKQLKLYDEWFARFGVDGAAEFDAKHIRDVAMLAGKYGKATGKQFRCRNIGNGKAAIIREA